MSAADYEFTSDWWLGADPGLVYDVLADPIGYPLWWPSVRKVEQIGPGSARMLCRSTLPYTLAIVTTADVVDPQRRVLKARLTGDLVGWSSWQICAAPDGTRALFGQQVRLTGRLGWVSTSLRPVFNWNHERMMAVGHRGLSGWLARASH